MLSLLSLFSGAGGLDLGLESAGFKVRLCVENEENCHNTLRTNRPSWKIAEPSDIFKITPKQLLEQARIKPGELDLLAGGPPCQPFSKAGYWHSGDSRRLSDPRAKTLHSYMEMVETLLPKVILLENVEGIRFEKKDEGLSLLKKKLRAINRRNGTNYEPVVFAINAADFGVPQIRKRIFLVASREGKNFVPPAPTHGSERNPHITAWDAIGDLEDTVSAETELKGSWTRLLPSIPEGQNYIWHTPRGGGKPIFGFRRRYWSFLLKLAKNKPSWTIQAQPGPSVGPFHWKNRALSVLEVARLQTFPDSYKITGSRRAAQKQLGNAVPPLLAEVIGREIAHQLLGASRKRTPLKLSIKRSSKMPDADEIKRVPRQFFDFIADHADHPGEGKGPGALSRTRALAEVS